TTSLITSFAWSRPMTPAITPSTPAAPQLGASSAGGGGRGWTAEARGELGVRRSRVEAAIAGALEGHEGRDLPVEGQDRGRDDRLAEADGSVVEQVAGREVVRPIDDHVVVGD